MTADAVERIWTDEPVFRVTSRGYNRLVGLWDYLTPTRADEAEQEANRWIKALRSVEIDGRPFRDRFTYRGDSLWWFAELYLHKTGAVTSSLRTILALEGLVECELPEALQLVEGDRVTGWLAWQVASARGVKFNGRRGVRLTCWRRTMGIRARASFFQSSALVRRLRDPTPAVGSQAAGAVCFVHSAFWRKGSDEDVYVGPVLRALAKRLAGRMTLVGVGPTTQFRGRGWRERTTDLRAAGSAADAVKRVESFAGWKQIEPSLAVWRMRGATRRALLASPQMKAASLIRDCNLWPIVVCELTGISHLQFPWSARAMDESAAALDTLAPEVVVTYAEAGGWGRALTLEARRRSIPVVALQHGFIYRHWLNYQHEEDELSPSATNAADRGFPLPTCTLLHDDLALKQLTTMGRFPSDALAVTGSTRLDSLVESARSLSPADLSEVRASIEARTDQHLVVVASKFSQLGPALSALAAAVRQMPDVFVLVKCHPAEEPDPYERIAESAPNFRVAGASSDLGRLIAASRVLVTVNSTAAIEAMVLGVPALVVNMPNNLTPFVEAGVMAGARRLEEIGPTLRSLLYDEEHRTELARLRRSFLTTNRIGSDGRAAERAVEAILARMAGPSSSCAH